jgi:RNA polymerase sigma factor (sigma-70 family)
MYHPDQKYVEALLNNNKVVLEEIYRRFSGKIKWMVLQNHGTVDDAADVFQDALISIYHKAKEQDFKLTCPLDAFLYLVCKKKWLNELSKRRIVVRLIDVGNTEETFSEDSFKLADDCAIKEQRLNLLLDKVAELSASAQQLLNLSWNGKSMDEVAETLGISYGYARKKKSECMEKLILLVQRSPEFSTLKDYIK